MSLMLVAPSAIAAAIESSTIPRSSSGDVPDQALPVRGDLQGMVPPVMLHGEERSSSGDCMVW
jgi:hypothetical protein